MSCLNSASEEPEFESVSGSPIQKHPLHCFQDPHHHQPNPQNYSLPTHHRVPKRIFDSVVSSIPTATSSPKLRLTLEDQDSLMTDADFEDIINRDQRVSMTIRPPSPLLPPTPAIFGYPAGGTRGVGVTRFSEDSVDHQAEASTDLQHQLSNLRFQPHYENETYAGPSTYRHVDHRRHQTDERNVKFENASDDGCASILSSVNFFNGTSAHAQTRRTDAKDKGKGKGKERATTPTSDDEHWQLETPRARSVLPRVGTLTALPGSTMKAQQGDIDEVESGHWDNGHGQTARFLASSPATHGPAANANTNTQNSLMPPPSIPSSDHRTFITPRQSRKRKLSLSAPFSNFKRILVSSGSKRNRNITHLTHEATAGNRMGGSGDHQQQQHSSRAVGRAGMSCTGRSDSNSDNDNESMIDNTATAPAPAPALREIPRRDLVTPVFGGPPTAYPSPPRTALNNNNARSSSSMNPAQTTNMNTNTNKSTSSSAARTIANTLLRPLHRRTDTNTSTITSSIIASSSNAGSDHQKQPPAPPRSRAPTNKSALNTMIVHLRTQISDLTLENRVLKDQIAIVRKDWIDAARELDVERHRVWEGEMERFRLRLEMEELRVEMGRVKRGSGTATE